MSQIFLPFTHNAKQELEFFLIKNQNDWEPNHDAGPVKDASIEWSLDEARYVSRLHDQGDEGPVQQQIAQGK